MAIQYLYPTTYRDPGNFHDWYVNGAGSQKASGTLSEEIDEGVSSINYGDFLSSSIIFDTGENTLTTSVSRNFVVPSSIICNVVCSSTFHNFRPLSTYYSGKTISATVKNINNGELVAYGGTDLGSGLLNLSFPLTILSRQVAPTDYIVDLSFENNYFPFDVNDYFIPNVYATELVSSGTIIAVESGIPLTILGGLDTSNFKRLNAFDDNYNESTSVRLVDEDWPTNINTSIQTFTNYAECYHRNDISGIFNSVYFTFNEGSGNVIYNGSKSGKIFSEDNQYRWLTDGTITDSVSLIENRNTYSTLPSTISSGQYIDGNDIRRTITQGNGLYLGPTRIITYNDTNYTSESIDRLQGVDLYNPLTTSGNFSLYFNMGYSRIRELTNNNGTISYKDDGGLLCSNLSFYSTIVNGNIQIVRRSDNSTQTWPLLDTEIDSIILTYNSGLITGYVLYPESDSWHIQSGTLTGLDCFGKLQIGRQEEIYGNYHNITMHQFGASDYAISRYEADNILEKICAPVNNFILRNGAHSVQTYSSGDIHVGVSYQKVVKNTNTKQHFLTNRIVFEDHQLYSIPESGYVFMDAYLAYTGNHPSGYLGITATSKVDGNNINPLWNSSYSDYQHKVFNSGGIQRITIGDVWRDSNPYPFNTGANTPEIDIWVTTPPTNSFYDGGDFRVYGLEFYTDSAFYVQPTGVANSIPLYTYGSGPGSGTLDLFCCADEHNDSLNLFVKAIDPVSGSNSIPLTIWTTGSSSGINSNSCTLYLRAIPSMSGELPLFIEGGGTDYRSGTLPLVVWQDTIYSSLPLFIEGRSGLIASNNLDLTIHSTADSGIFASVPFSIAADNFTGNMNLFIKSEEQGSNVGSLNLFIGNESSTSNSCTLTVLNTDGAINSGVKLFIKGDGINDGAYFGYGSLNLFINRGNDSIDGGISLSVFGPSGTTNSIPLTVTGGNLVSNNVTLALPNTVGTPSGGISIYTSGY